MLKGLLSQLLFIATLLLISAACGHPADQPQAELLPAVSSPDGINIAYADEGPRDAPIAVVLIHGWSCDRDYWSGQVPALVGDYRVVRIDLPGHGGSGSERESWTIEAYGSDVEALVTALGLQRIILVGHSMGGYVALEAAQRMPSRVLGVVGVDTLLDAEWSLPPEAWEAWLAPWGDDFTGQCDLFVRGMFPEGSAETLVDEVAGKMCGADPQVGLALFRAFGSYNLAEEFAATKAPIHCINADMNPTKVDINRKYAPSFEVEIMKGCGHFLMLEKPEEFNRILLDVLQGFETPQES